MTTDDEIEEFDEDDLADGFGEEVISEEDLAVEVDLDIDVLEEEVEVVEIEAVEEKEVSDDADAEEVELALDEILAATVNLTTGDANEDEDEDIVTYTSDVDDGAIPLPLQDDEFKCRGCRLLKSQSQLVDEVRMLCRDCV
jgi:hypothetical protein